MYSSIAFSITPHDNAFVKSGRQFRLQHQHFILDAFLEAPLDETRAEPLTQAFVADLLRTLGMSKLGSLGVYGAADERAPGWSFIQPITTSHISGHYFVKPGKGPHIRLDVYSCEAFHWLSVVMVAHKHFKLADWAGTFLERELDGGERKAWNLSGTGDHPTVQERLCVASKGSAQVDSEKVVATEQSGSVKAFMERHYTHFNSRETLAAAKAYAKHVSEGGKVLLALAGAMSTAEMGKSLAQMIRSGCIHAVSSTGANLEEDLFGLLAHNEYEMLPHYAQLTPADEQALLQRGLNRVTDTCVPERVMLTMASMLLPLWKQADEAGETKFHHQYFFDLIAAGKFDQEFCQGKREDSWVVAAYEMGIPIFVPGHADSSMGNMFATYRMQGVLSRDDIMASDVAQYRSLMEWYARESAQANMGFFQIGGGIAGDFAVCCVPSLRQDMKQDVPFWSYFAQISDSNTSYGSYSGAPPNEKITWSKLGMDSAGYMIQSDATIVAPLVFQYVLDSIAESAQQTVQRITGEHVREQSRKQNEVVRTLQS